MDEEDPTAAFDWGITPLDAIQGCYFHLQADWSKVRQNRNLGDDRRRAVVETLEPWSTEMPVRAFAVSFRIPSPELEKWRLDMRQMCKDSISYHGSSFLMGGGAKNTAFGYLWGLMQHKLIYDTHAQP